MDPNLSSGKGKPSHLLAGIYTGSKSQIYVHNSRSGRFDGVGCRNQTLESCRASESLNDDSGVVSPISVKDIRAGRVFSPASEDLGLIPTDLSPDTENLCSDLGKTDAGVLISSFDDVEQVNNLSPIPINLSTGLVNMCIDLGKSDAEVLSSGKEMDPIWEGKKKGVHDTTNGNENQSLTVDVKRLNNLPKRRKLYKATSSLGYRRLLPYIMNAEKDDSCYPKIKVVDIGSPWKNMHFDFNNTNMGVNGEPSVAYKYEGSCALDVTEPQKNVGMTKVEKCESLKLKEESPKLSSGKPIIKLPRVGSYEGHMDIEAKYFLEECDQSTPPNTYVHGKLEPRETLAKNVLHNGTTMRSCGRQVVGINGQKNGSNMTSELVHKPFSSECAQSPQLYSLGRNEMKVTTAGTEANSLQIDACYSSKNHTCGVRKGILKRNPRGCRGLCNCLSCATFRLHAARAFEFSQNQMKDAEEVALDLIKEIADMRTKLEESALDASNHVVQVKEMFKKSLVAEELAKKCLRQMNEDLSFHCRNRRLERPRVAFASTVEKRIIPNAKLPRNRK